MEERVEAGTYKLLVKSPFGGAVRPVKNAEFEHDLKRAQEDLATVSRRNFDLVIQMLVQLLWPEDLWAQLAPPAHTHLHMT